MESFSFGFLLISESISVVIEVLIEGAAGVVNVASKASMALPRFQTSRAPHHWEKPY
ncbi:hypothetical protein N2605_27980 [Bradyrhizobium yuanmingense]|uniref:hypothetical protein n=1 Tax=Bradyrhizobium yuanmingense TaxID=108015 RepID=UPI0021A656E9|nr:hypothetical protein [Bradyrhizobium sp. CB1024]UWU83329.1 hypothetical protein N2605_27980 [Bradyrhizobium sp. CB1024]